MPETEWVTPNEHASELRLCQEFYMKFKFIGFPLYARFSYFPFAIQNYKY